MLEKILGIDIGSSSLKVVQVRRGFRRLELGGYASAGLPAGAAPREVAGILHNLISEQELQSDRYLLSVSTREAFLRRLSFPFAGEGKIAQVVAYELENILPVGIDEVLVDFIKTERLADGSQGVLAAALPRKVIEPLLAALGEVGIEADSVDLDGSALVVIAAELREHLADNSVLLDVGHGKTNLLYRRQDRSLYLRALPFSCSLLAGKVAGVLDISPEEAVSRIFSSGLSGFMASPEEERAREAVAGEVKSLAREMELSMLSARPPEDAEPEQVVLCGGGSLVEGLGPALEKVLEIPVRPLFDVKELGFFNHFKDRPPVLAQFAGACALALRAGKRKTGFNFQAGKTRGLEQLLRWRRHLAYGLAAAALVAASWLGSVGVDIYARSEHLSDLRQATETVFQRTFPELQGSVQPAQYASIFKARIQELDRAVSLFGTDSRQHLTIEVLRDISEAISPSLNVTLDMLSMDDERVRLSGKADSFNTVDAVKNRLQATGSFSRVAIAGAKAATDGKGVQFSLDLERKLSPGEGL